MAIKVSSIAELQKVMMDETYKALQNSSDDLIDEIKESIDEIVNRSYTPSPPDGYKRTHDLENTLQLSDTKNNGTQASITINHDTDKGRWFSVKSGGAVEDSSNSTVPEIVTYGKYGYFNGIGADGEYHHINPSGTEWGQPRDYMLDAKYRVESNGYKFLQNHLPPNATIK